MAQQQGSQKPKALNDLATVTGEMIRIFPEGLIMASGLYALITLSFPFAVFTGSMVEASLILRGIRYIAQYLNLSSPSLEKEALNPLCRSGFKILTMESYSLFPSEYIKMFPSTQIFMIASAISYVLSTLSSQSKELEALGPSYSSRFYISLMFSVLFLLTFVVFRLYNSCDTVWSVLFSIVIGFLIGSLLVAQNRAIFGSYGNMSVNLIGIPLLANRATNGQTLYICPTTASK
jgi:hypothetical protein